MLKYLRKVTNRASDAGASAVEYGLLVAGIAAVVIVAVFALGNVVNDTFNNTKDCIASEGGTCS